jgi:hypothetical protein
MTTDSTEEERPLLPLRSTQIERLLEAKPKIAEKLLALRPELTEVGIILSRRQPSKKSPPLGPLKTQQLRRQERVEAGICIFSAEHGKATNGPRCKNCHDKEMSRRRAARARG